MRLNTHAVIVLSICVLCLPMTCRAYARAGIVRLTVSELCGLRLNRGDDGEYEPFFSDTAQTALAASGGGRYTGGSAITGRIIYG